ncbi:CAAX prenyl protease-like protein [Nocardia tenerifensis]|uniref:CAAX prenyl protease-like protein n=1 Tax=Nocardia tenerifensis TaxID=228006 RepID=A0A318KV08_9NOCA|nr:type II CAAX endopeptidase family protein [Nocardia tenerifensis]PXX68571.1 CAAX prenyl protease-like protein [Nocardia tenerifensis]
MTDRTGLRTAEATRTAPPSRAFWALIGVYVLSTLLGSAAMLALQPVSGIDPAALSLVQFAPTIGALATWPIGRRVLAPLSSAPSRTVRRNLGYLVAACLLFGLLIAVATVSTGRDLVGPAPVGGVPFLVFFVAQFIGAAGEEIGWRGLLQPLLETRTRRLVAIAVTGAAWALWHVQAFGAGPVVAVSFFVSTMAFAALLGALSVGGFRQRVLVAAVGHWLINVGVYLSVGDETHGRPHVVIAALAAVSVAAATLTVRSIRAR